MQESVVDTASYKTQTAECPPDKQAIGGGYQLLNLGMLTATPVRPFVTENGPEPDDPSNWTVTVEDVAASNGASGGRWGLRVYAICSAALP